MPARDRQRLRICLVVVLCLFFQQMAVAAYACTMPRMVDVTLLGEACDAMEGMEMAPSQDAPALCVQHCAPDPSVLSDLATPGVPMLTFPPIKRDLLRLPSAWHATGVAIVRSDPPPRLRYCSLLI